MAERIAIECFAILPALDGAKKMARHIGNNVFAHFDGAHIVLFNHGKRTQGVKLGSREISELRQYIARNPSLFGWNEA